ncbi:MAG: hypothetical protein BGO67_12010 [Alphaproteobacteria bacterium 41-28]|nr:MAG: hypothetical protein BGO67_12010 [Alphaproteobacteria bacterium 41-28]
MSVVYGHWIAQPAFAKFAKLVPVKTGDDLLVPHFRGDKHCGEYNDEVVSFEQKIDCFGLSPSQ